MGNEIKLPECYEHESKTKTSGFAIEKKKKMDFH